MTEKTMIEKERFTVTINGGGDGFTMNLANGSLDVPDQGGCYVLSTGCGAGKTESVKSLIRQRADAGIVYCVDTVAELQKMHQWIKDNLCTTGSLSEKDVVCISCDFNDQADLLQYKDNPSSLTGKKVILLTHVRFWTDLINFFLVYNPTIQEPSFDGDFKKLMARDDLRKYIIFDETPLFIKSFATLPKYIFGLMGEEDKKGKWHCIDRVRMDKRYDDFLKNTPQELFKENTMLAKVKREVMLNLIERRYDKFRSMAKKQKKVNITFTPADLCQQTVNTHVLIYEGAGDVLFSNYGCYQLKDIPRKYDGKLNFHELKRKKGRYEHYTDQEKQYVADEITNVINTNNGSTLVIVWQTVGKNARDKTDKTTSDFVDDLKVRIKSKQPYYITYFGSNKTKSTNDFRDYDNIILWGKWGIVNTDTNKFKDCYGTATTNQGHNLWYFIQLLSRIGIRKHRLGGKTYNVHYTDDYSRKFIQLLSDYFNKNQNNVISAGVTLEQKLKDKGVVHKQIIAKIIILAQRDSIFEQAILHSKPYSASMTSKELYSIIPIGKMPKKDNYKSLVDNLKKVNIELNIN